jgi:YD repeat-containing protein
MNSIARAPKESDLIAYTTAVNSNRLQTVSGPVAKTYTYDAAGNPKSDGQTTFTWNAGEKLASTLRGGKTHTYKTNAFDQRISKHGPLSQRFFFFYDSAGQLIGEYRENSRTTTPTDDWLVRQETVWLGNIPVAVIKKPTATSAIRIYDVHADHLNTPRVIVNSRNPPFGVGTMRTHSVPICPMKIRMATLSCLNIIQIPRTILRQRNESALQLL